MLSSPLDLEQLDEVQQTSLWTLVSRARFAEAGLLEDPEALRLAAALPPELRARFGRPDPAFAARARLLDDRLRAWLDGQPEAAVTVVSLGEGLETQRFRVEGYGRWVSVDLPEVIALRTRLIPPDARHAHRSESVTRLEWLDEAAPPGSCVIAQGLLMYLDEAAVRRLLTSWGARASAASAPPGARGALLFDVVPPWVRALSKVRIPVSRRFRLPPMPWAVGREALERTVRDTVGDAAELSVHPCPLPAGPLPLAGQTWIAELRV